MIFARFFLCLPLALCLASPSAAAAPKKIYNLCQIIHPSDATIPWDCLKLKKGDSPWKLFGNHWPEVLRFNRLDRRHFGSGLSLKVPRDLTTLAGFSPLPREYPAAAEDEKFILIDLGEQYLGAYEHGQLRLALPIASGSSDNPTPAGDFRITAFDREHQSSLYQIEKTEIPYPMHYALRFYTNPVGVAYWLHGRDVPGFPASHGCIGLYDEEMQLRYYENPAQPTLRDAAALFKWVIGTAEDRSGLTMLKNGPLVRIIDSLTLQETPR
ncbi:MAG: L,D-transpeptidase [Desulfobulbaceae bacterium]|nr:L,D-transpeptidase [Desulfobulbaceae bacterium]